MSAIVALQHEYAHAFTAAKLGFRLNKVTLMPYGAVIDGDLEGITAIDELKVALSGPFCNLCTALFFVSIWWLFPDTYAFTDLAFFASISIFLVNLLPAYPLDGGRALFCLLKHLFCRRGISPKDAARKAKKICKIASFVVALLALAIFIILQVRKTSNLTLLFFSLFLAVGAVGCGGEADYGRLPLSTFADLKKGAEIRTVAFDESTPAKRAVCFLEKGKYLVLQVHRKGEKIGVLSQDDFLKGLESKPFTAPLGDFLFDK
ncbi:MAG: hypothetical protein IJV80_06625 [Clostridia bacterium]|nr:hypothetical protein [Clostridia bacterium]